MAAVVELAVVVEAETEVEGREVVPGVEGGDETSYRLSSWQDRVATMTGDFGCMRKHTVYLRIRIRDTVQCMR